MKITKVVCAAFVAGLLAYPAFLKADDDDKDEAFKDLPAPVQKAITAAANGGAVGEIEAENEDGKVVYEADITGADGKKSEVTVAADGTVVKDKDDDDDKGGKGKDDDDK
jgi:uncharacterized membrane protein YkoI